MARRASATKPRARARRRTPALYRPAPLVHRRVPLVSRLHPPARGRSDSVIAAIAEVIRDAMTADGDGEPVGEEPERLWSRMVSLTNTTKTDGDRCSRIPAA